MAQLDRHRDVLLGDLGRRAGAAVAPVDVKDVRPGVVRADRDHVHVGRGRDLHRDERPGVDRLDPVDVLLVVLDGVDGVERERGEQAAPTARSRASGRPRWWPCRRAGGRRGRAWRPART